MKKTMILLLILSICCMFTGCSDETACAHQFATAIVSEASCQKGGSLKHTCGLCGITYSQTTPAADHNFTEIVTLEATCTQEGTLTATCASCGQTEEKPVPLADHQFDFYSLNPSRCTVCQETVEGGAADPENPWYGKTWVAIGTSLTSEKYGKYVEPLAERSGLQVTNLGIADVAAVDQILEAVENADLSQADLITVEFGVYDWSENVPLGNFGDTTPYRVTVSEESNEESDEESDEEGQEESIDGSFAGSCYQIFKLLEKSAPNAVIVFLSDSTGQNYEQTGENYAFEGKNNGGLFQRDYAEMAITIARYMGISIIDAGSMSMVNRQHPQYLADHIHHTELGGQQYALTIWMELKDILPLLKAE